MSEPKQFKTMEEKRIDCKRRLAAAFRLFARYGFDEGIAGHISVRDPEQSDCFWVNPMGLYFGHICVSDLVLVNDRGVVIEGDQTINAAAFAIHSEIHKMRPDVNAVAHAHSHYGKAWSTLGRLLDPMTQDACAFYEDHALFDDYTGVVLDSQEGKRIANALELRKAVILRNHGLLTVGQSVDEAVWWFITMDRSCHVQLLAEAAGNPVSIEPEMARLTGRQVGDPESGRINFLPLYTMIVEQEPDLLD